ncbi:MAG TPA: threonine dehydratase, partial [Verrucomicrobiae bacterium]|nr:threonine dehydratase [Verrucomicrobiae bacterium]
EVWVKHENHTPVGAFKVRGGLVYFDCLRRQRSHVRQVVSATRGNHGQSLAFAARRTGIEVNIVVPLGNNPEKNNAMRALGANLIERGKDFDEAREFAKGFAREHGAEMIPSYDPLLVLGVATYALELFTAVSGIDTVYVPIGLGSGICGVIRVRDLLGLPTRVVGVVAANAPAYARSFAAGQVITTPSPVTIADGVATRVPVPEALDIIRAGADRILEVTEPEIAAAARAYFTDTHNLAEGAGALGLAALLQERERMRGKRAGLVLTGGNIDRQLFARILAEG